jgi:CRP/FNR family transcriptional regulator
VDAGATLSFAGDLLKSFALFDRLPPEIASRLLRGHGYRLLSPGTILLAQGEKASELFCVVSGLVKLVIRGGRQKERIIDIVGPGQCFCMASLFLELPSPVTAVVLEPGQALSLKREAVTEAAAAHPPLAIRLLGRVSWQLFQRIREAEIDTATSSAERVVRWLRSHLPAGNPTGSVVIVLHHTKKTTAQSLNVTPETFSRVLRHLRGLELIEVGRREIKVIDAARLADVPLNVFGARPCVVEGTVQDVRPEGGPPTW